MSFHITQLPFNFHNQLYNTNVSQKKWKNKENYVVKINKKLSEDKCEKRKEI